MGNMYALYANTSSPISRDTKDLKIKNMRCFAFETTPSICKENDRLLSKMTPRSLTDSKTARGLLSITNSLVSSKGDLPLSRTLPHLGTESCNCHDLDHETRESSAN